MHTLTMELLTFMGALIGLLATVCISTAMVVLGLSFVLEFWAVKRARRFQKVLEVQMEIQAETLPRRAAHRLSDAPIEEVYDRRLSYADDCDRWLETLSKIEPETRKIPIVDHETRILQMVVPDRENDQGAPTGNIEDVWRLPNDPTV